MSAMARASGPETLTIETAPVPEEVAGAHMVSLKVLIIIGLCIPWGYLAHIVQEVFVGLVLVHKVEHKVHSLYRVHIGKYLAKDPDPVCGSLGVEEVVTACSGEKDVHGREDAPVAQGPVHLDFAVAGAAEFLP